MEVDFETAVQTLVRSGVDQDPRKRVTIGLIVAVLSRKFSHFPEEQIYKAVNRAIVAEGGIVDMSIPASISPALIGKRLTVSGTLESFA